VNQPDVRDVWLVDLDPAAGHEQGGQRPCVVVSDPRFNRLPINMRIVVPLTPRDRGLSHQPPIQPGTSGLTRLSYARPEDVRAVSSARFDRQLGKIEPDELEAIRQVVRLFLGASD
jgi:mRNA interferase MazF